MDPRTGRANGALAQAQAALEAAGVPVDRLKFPAHCVIVHAGHASPGVFVSCSGTLERRHADGRVTVLPAPAVVPDPRLPDLRSAEGIATRTDVEALFVPRSRLLASRSSLETILRALAPLMPHATGEATPR